MTYEGLDGKVAIVTGAAGGIGRSVVERLSRAGASVVVVDARQDAADEVVASLDGPALAVAADVSTEAGVEKYMDAALETFGAAQLHHLNAGIAGTPAQQLTDASADEWDRVMAVNLRGPFLGTRAALRHFVRTGTTGNIVITGSIAGVRGAADLLAYTTSKHGVSGLVHGAAVYAGPIGVRVNSVNPGIIPTPIFGEAGLEDMRRRASTSPLRRAGRPEEIASAVAFLLSDDSSYITGATLMADGGASVQNTNRFAGGAGLWDPSEIDAALREAFDAS